METESVNREEMVSMKRTLDSGWGDREENGGHKILLGERRRGGD